MSAACAPPLRIAPAVGNNPGSFHASVPSSFSGHAVMQSRQEVQRAWWMVFTSSTGMAMGQAFAHFTQQVQVSAIRWMRAAPKREKGLSTAASGQSHRQKGTVTSKEPAATAPAVK